jgi:hypothetical protein
MRFRASAVLFDARFRRVATIACAPCLMILLWYHRSPPNRRTFSAKAVPSADDAMRSQEKRFNESIPKHLFLGECD